MFLLFLFRDSWQMIFHYLCYTEPKLQAWLYGNTIMLLSSHFGNNVFFAAWHGSSVIHRSYFKLTAVHALLQRIMEPLLLPCTHFASAGAFFKLPRAMAVWDSLLPVNTCDLFLRDWASTAHTESSAAYIKLVFDVPVSFWTMSKMNQQKRIIIEFELHVVY